MQLSQQLEECEWVPKARLTPLRRLGIHTVEDLVTHFPRRHEDRREFAGFPRDESEVPICICGEVVKTRVMRFGGYKKIFEATLEEAELERAEPAARAALVQPALRAEDDRDGSSNSWSSGSQSYVVNASAWSIPSSR
jgi:RecG-like helicase